MKKSNVETAKEESRHLRGNLEETLAALDKESFDADDVHVLKFHGVYQQDQRDLRKGGGKQYQFMVRAALPGGVLSAQQYLALDAFGDRYANQTLRVTTRQGLQYHGVLKGDLKTTIASMNAELVSTLAACGDVARNVMACPAPLADPAHRKVQEAAHAIAEILRPASEAYHEIWLDQEKLLDSRSEEPFYGDAYLPRKFKTAVACGCDNCVDVYTQDCGLIAVTEGDQVVGFNVVVGGGQGMTNRRADTFAALAQPLGFVAPEFGAAAVKVVAAVFRDFGNRSDRRHARLKYLLADWGLEAFRQEFERQADFPLLPYRELPETEYQDHLGAHQQYDGAWFYGFWVQSGRIGGALKSAIRQLVEELNPGVRFTPHQNVLLTGLDEAGLQRVREVLGQHGVTPVEEMSGARRHSMACPALPTCGLAVAESERKIPELVESLENVLRELGLWGAPMSLRMTGCPNGCARPYTADLAFVGRSLDLYQIYVGGRSQGDRLGDLFAGDVATADLVETVKPLLRRWANERLSPDESLGDFYQRLRGGGPPRQQVTGREEPTRELVVG